MSISSFITIRQIIGTGLGVANQVLFNTAAADFVNVIGQASTAIAAENSAQNVIPVGGILKNAFVNVVTNGNTVNGILVLRKNGVNTNITITVTALTIGIFKDIVNTVTVAAGDLLSWSTTQAVTANANYNGITMEFDPT